MVDKTRVTMIQSADGQTRRVRIGDTEIPVANAAPIPGAGCMNFALTIADVEVAFEGEAAKVEPAPGA